MTDQPVLTEFNSNAAVLQRIDQILRVCADASYQGRLLQWYEALELLKREAISKMKHTRERGEAVCKKDCIRCECNTRFEKINKLIQVHIMNPNDTMTHTRIRMHLDTTEVFLRDFMDGKGMLLRDGKNTMERLTGGSS